VAGYVAAASGTGFVYIPQPNGTVVAEIEVTTPRTGLLLGMVAIAVVLLVIDVTLTILMKTSVRRRYS
jgi:hypothetical protein